MRVLLYNWIPLQDSTGRGAGVDVYVKNLIVSLYQSGENVELFYLSSGTYYDVEDIDIRYEYISEEYMGVPIKQFAIINSPVFAPASLSYLQIRSLLEDNKLKSVLVDFLNTQGPFDIVHFHNLEGLSLDSINLKNKFKNIKFIYTIHNYYPFCPQVQLWKNNIQNCTESNTGFSCLECRKYNYTSEEKMRQKMSLQYHAMLNGACEEDEEIVALSALLDEKYEKDEEMYDTELLQRQLGQYFQKYRKSFVNIINGNIDVVLVVSKRVGFIAEKMGINKNIIEISYIGSSAVKSNGKEIAQRKDYDAQKPLTIAYLGYRRPEKGYDFFVKVLSSIPQDVAKQIRVVIAARGIEENEYKKLKLNYKNISLFDGYKREELPALLEHVDVGLVPVLWEDNLPQIAIELAANGVVVLASDLGGASELCNDSLFRFEAGNVKECVDRITQFVTERKLLGRYWEHYNDVNDSQAHIKALMLIFS